MGLESGTFISDLNANNPVGATDPKSQGDDHLRLIKATILATFPNVTGAVNPTQVELNFLVGVTSGLQAQLNTLTTADGQNVKLTGAQDVAGAKNFTDPLRAASVELGHASDTTVARIAAGRVSIEGGEVAKLNASQPFTAMQEFRGTGASIAQLWKTNEAANTGRWSFFQSAGTMQLATMSDAGSVVETSWRVLRTGTGVTGVELWAANRLQVVTQPDNVAPATTGAQVKHADAGFYDVGLNVMPPLARSASATFSRTDVGKTIVFTTGSNTTQTLPASTDTDIPVGAAINLYASSGGNVTIAQGSGITLSRPNGNGAAASGNRVLAQGGVATLWKFSSTVWIIWGNAGLN